MRNLFFLSGGLAAALLLLCVAGLTGDAPSSEPKTDLKLMIFAGDWTRSFKGSPDDLEIRFVFINKGSAPAKLFLPLTWKDYAFVFFGLDVVDGSMISTRGKVDLAASDMRYVVLAKYEMFGVKIKAKDLLHDLPREGSWRLRGEYHNQYGEEDCFHGGIKSEDDVKLEFSQSFLSKFWGTR